jgi:hypothetical protein
MYLILPPIPVEQQTDRHEVPRYNYRTTLHCQLTPTITNHSTCLLCVQSNVMSDTLGDRQIWFPIPAQAEVYLFSPALTTGTLSLLSKAP